jgi:quinol monooxygenase YgiN
MSPGYVVLVEMTVDAAHGPEVQTRVLENARLSREREPGCRRFDVAVAPGDASRILLVEIYDNRAAFDAHLATSHFLSFDATVKPWVLDKQVRFFDLIEEPSALRRGG